MGWNVNLVTYIVLNINDCIKGLSLILTLLLEFRRVVCRIQELLFFNFACLLNGNFHEKETSIGCLG